MAIMYAEPSWMRLGFSEPPDHQSGQGIGLVIIDDISPHTALQHLGNRLKNVIVRDDLSITCRDISYEGLDPSTLDHGKHGLMTVLTLAHRPFIDNGFYHTGIATAGNFVVLSHGAFRDGQGDRLKRGIDWILENIPEFNIRIILTFGWHAQDNPVLLKRTACNSTVQALSSAVERGILVVCANGNSDITTIMPPMDYMAVGGFNDRGSSDRALHAAYHGELFGLNGDGHFRPDIRAPRTRVAVPYCEGEPNESSLSYYTGTSSASTLVAGVCMHLLSRFPSISNQTLRNALACFGEQLSGDSNSAPCINVQRTVEAIMNGCTNDQNVVNQSVDTTGVVERAIEFCGMIRAKGYTREELWERANDPDPRIRKIAVHTLGSPVSRFEREQYWNRLSTESEDGVRTWYLHGLLQNATKEEVRRWIPMAASPHWSIRWCVAEFLNQFPEWPQLEKTHDPELVTFNAEPVLKWFENHR